MKARQLSCDEEASLTPFNTARAAALSLVRALDRREVVPLAEARGRILAATVRAPRQLPPFDQAAMDGYALRASNAARPPHLLRIDGRTVAGDGAGVCGADAAHRIFTGAAMPSGADAVVMQERATVYGDKVHVGPGVVPGANVRRAGEDISCGMTVVEAGMKLGWREIGLLAAMGLGSVQVMRGLRIAILVTGSELQEPGETVEPAHTFDSNGPMLEALLSAPGCSIARRYSTDDAQAIAHMLTDLARTADLVVSTGGMSVGEEDHMRRALVLAGGELVVAKVAMKPGKPLALGRLGNACFVGLPGNPQAVAVGAVAFIRPMMAKLLGRPEERPITASIAFEYVGQKGRTELIPVRLDVEAGQLFAQRCGDGSSHRLMPLALADAFAVMPDCYPQLPRGVCVEVLPFG
jgi:molybdopterin molybdotransferase